MAATQPETPLTGRFLVSPRRLLAALAPFLALLASARPVVRIENARGVGVHSVGETMFAEVGGRTWFFKKDGASQVLHHGNFEGEALAARILTRLGFPVPQSRLVEIEGQEGAWFQTELVDQALTRARQHEQDHSRLLLLLTLAGGGLGLAGAAFFLRRPTG